MPRIPDESSLGYSVPRTRTPRFQDRSGEIVAEAVGGFARTLGQVADSLQEHDDQFNYARAKSTLLTADVEARKELENDQDWETYEKRYTERMSKAREQASGLIRGGRSRSLFDMDAKLDVDRGLQQIRGKAKEKEISWGRATLDEQLEGLRNSGLQAEDEPSREAHLSAMSDLIDGALAKGYIDPVERVNIRQARTVDYAAGWLSMQPASAQVELLSNPKAKGSAILKLIPPDKQSALLEQAQRENLANEERAIRLFDRGRKSVADNLSKEGDELMFSGELTPQWIEKNRGAMDPSDVRYFYQKLADGGSDSGPRDALRYVELRDSAGRGVDVRDEAREALRKGQIRVSDYDRIVGEVEQSRPSWYKRGSDYISTSAAVSDLNPDPAAAQRKASMLDDWNDWANSNQKATEQEAQAAYQRIVKEYAIVDYGKMALMKRAPQFLAGTRNAPDFDATETATVRAFNEQRITREEFERQAKLIQEWRDAFHKAQAK